MIESGSTCALLAQKLGESDKWVNLITGSLYIARVVRPFQHIKTTLIGGEVQNDSEACIGPLAKENVERYFVSKCFFGIDGYTTQNGYTSSDERRAEITIAMGKQSMKKVALTTSDKFLSRGIIRLFAPKEVNIVVTDNRLKNDIKKEIENNGTEVYLIQNKSENLK